jgi:cob(I)alamin adenosyltransferase
MYNRRVPKNHPRVAAYGCVDELNAALGLARSICTDKFVLGEIFAAQKDLIIVMGELATDAQDRWRYLKDGFQLTNPEMVERITAVIVDLEKDKSLYPKGWAIPGQNALSAGLDFARAICRRAEQEVVALAVAQDDFNPEILRYLNRLSDLCWILARYVEKQSQSDKGGC